jgi:hypothetical protein
VGPGWSGTGAWTSYARLHAARVVLAPSWIRRGQLPFRSADCKRARTPTLLHKDEFYMLTRSRATLLYMCAILGFASCSNAYPSIRSRTLSATRMGDGVFRLYCANAGEGLTNYFLFRAAEVALENDCPCFEEVRDNALQDQSSWQAGGIGSGHTRTELTYVFRCVATLAPNAARATEVIDDLCQQQPGVFAVEHLTPRASAGYAKFRAGEARKVP